MNYSYTPIANSTIKKTDNRNVHTEVEQFKVLCITAKKVNWYNHFGKLLGNVY